MIETIVTYFKELRGNVLVDIIMLGQFQGDVQPGITIGSVGKEDVTGDSYMFKQ